MQVSHASITDKRTMNKICVIVSFTNCGLILLIECHRLYLTSSTLSHVIFSEITFSIFFRESRERLIRYKRMGRIIHEIEGWTNKTRSTKRNAFLLPLNGIHR